MDTENKHFSDGRYARDSGFSIDFIEQSETNKSQTNTADLMAHFSGVTPGPIRNAPPENQRDHAKPDAPATVSSSCPPDAFWDLWSTHQDRLLRQCMKMMSGNIADAEDALSNAMIRAMSHYSEGKGAAINNQRAWLTRIVHNSCIDFFRARSRQKRWTEEVLAMEDCSIVPALPSPEPSPEEVAETGEAMRSLQRGLDDLPDVLRDPIILRFLEGRSYAEIADRLRITNCTARKRVQLARERLRRNGAGPTP